MRTVAYGVGLLLLAFTIGSPIFAAEPQAPQKPQPQRQAQKPQPPKLKGGQTRLDPSCGGTTYFSCICPGDQLCATDNGEYDFPVNQCDQPVTVTAQNIDNLVGSLKLSDPPCKEPNICKRVSVFDSSSAPNRDPACRCREKLSVCKPK